LAQWELDCSNRCMRDVVQSHAMSRSSKTVLSSLLSDLLAQRGVRTPEEIGAFLYPNYDTHLHDPFLLIDMQKGVDRILRAIQSKENITVYADFDCDGIPAAVILHDFFKKVGCHDNVGVYIPHRHNEGYGFHKEAIDAIRENKTTLIITVDVGINAYETALYAKEHGIDVVITDHHEINGSLPQAVAVINPKREPYLFSDLCGAGVAYKLVQALISEGKKAELEAFSTIQDGWEKWLLDMVGLATIADMVPLIGENRVLASYGLTVLRKTPRPGIVALCRKLRIEQKDMTEDDIGFLIAPRINAASRMDEARVAFILLSTADSAEAEEAARQLEILNRKRKGVVGALVKEARKREKEREEHSRVYVTGSVEWKPSLLGLVANALADTHPGAVCVWGCDGKGNIKGSCRSDGSVHVVEMFTSANLILEEYGGHKHAGGFSVSRENIHRLSEIFNAAAVQGGEKNGTSAVPELANPLSLGHVSWDMLQELKKLSPFGVGNDKPIFQFSNVLFEDVRVFGKERNHTEIILGDKKIGGVRAFQFFTTPDSFSNPPAPGKTGTILATLERDSFNGQYAVALRIVDVR